MSGKRRPKAAFTAAEWNARYPSGTTVLFQPILGRQEFVPTRTRSDAWELGHGEPVVLLEGRAGGCALSHLTLPDE